MSLSIPARTPPGRSSLGSPSAAPAVAREIAHLQRRYERARTAGERALPQLDQLAFELSELKREQEIEDRR